MSNRSLFWFLVAPGAVFLVLFLVLPLVSIVPKIDSAAKAGHAGPNVKPTVKHATMNRSAISHRLFTPQPLLAESTHSGPAFRHRMFVRHTRNVTGRRAYIFYI